MGRTLNVSKMLGIRKGGVEVQVLVRSNGLLYIVTKVFSSKTKGNIEVMGQNRLAFETCITFSFLYKLMSNLTPSYDLKCHV